MAALSGYCNCGGLRFELKEEPLFVHACHCLDCKRKSGYSFSLTCIVLESDILVTHGSLRETFVSPSSTARHCAKCNVKIYRTSTGFPAIARVQANCFEDLRQLHIGVHTWVKRKDEWLQLPEGLPGSGRRCWMSTRFVRTMTKS